MNGILTYFTDETNNIVYSAEMVLMLVVMSVTSLIAVLLVNLLFYRFKVSWSKLILTMQIVIVFAFDTFVMGEKFETTGLVGCLLLVVSNLLCFLSGK